jgi:hypothetical protein
MDVKHSEKESFTMIEKDRQDDIVSELKQIKALLAEFLLKRKSEKEIQQVQADNLSAKTILQVPISLEPTTELENKNSNTDTCNDSESSQAR